MDFLTNWLSGANTSIPSGGKSAAEFLERNGELINQVVQDIIGPFINHIPTPSPRASSKSDTQETDLTYTLKLMDADTCGQMAFFLSKNMSEMIKTYDISGFGGPINTIAPGTKSITEADIQTPNGMVSRKQICDRLAGHYITIINLIAAILTGINPQTNMALSRMNSLYTLVDGTTDTFLINICMPDGDKAVKAHLLDEPGVREFMSLYLFHLLSVSETPSDKDRVMREYQNLVRKLVDEDRTVAMPLKLSSSENTLTPELQSQPQSQSQSEPTSVHVPEAQPGAAANELQTDQPNTAVNPDMIANNPQAESGIFGNLPEKLSSGLGNLFGSSSTAPTAPSNASSSSSSSSSLSSSSSSGTSSGTSSNTSINSVKLQKQNEIDYLKAEIQQTSNRNKKIALTQKLQGLIFALQSSNSKSSSSESSSRSRRHKKHRRRTTSSDSSNRSSQYGGAGQSADASVARFVTFIEKYIDENPNDKRTMLRNVLTIFKGGHFKKPDQSRIKTLCKNANSVGKEIQLHTNSNNPYLKTYHDNWLEMRHKYMKSVGSLVDILENRILFVNEKTQKMELRNISSKELADLETQTRILLAELYSNAHQHYVMGVNALHDYYHNLTAGVDVY